MIAAREFGCTMFLLTLVGLVSSLSSSAGTTFRITARSNPDHFQRCVWMAFFIGSGSLKASGIETTGSRFRNGGGIF